MRASVSVCLCRGVHARTCVEVQARAQTPCISSCTRIHLNTHLTTALDLTHIDYSLGGEEEEEEGGGGGKRRREGGRGRILSLRDPVAPATELQDPEWHPGELLHIVMAVCIDQCDDGDPLPVCTVVLQCFAFRPVRHLSECVRWRLQLLLVH